MVLWRKREFLHPSGAGETITILKPGKKLTGIRDGCRLMKPYGDCVNFYTLRGAFPGLRYKNLSKHAFYLRVTGQFKSVLDRSDII